MSLQYSGPQYGIQVDLGAKSDFLEFVGKCDFKKLHFITGCGFELRARVIAEWLAESTDLRVQCTIVDLLNKNDPLYERARTLQQENMQHIRNVVSIAKWPRQIVTSNLYSGRSVAHRPLQRALMSILRRFEGDFLVDISSLPRSIALPALKILWGSSHVRNLLVTYTQEPRTGALERQARNFAEPDYLPLFHQPRAGAGFSVWFPILGWDPRPIRKIDEQFVFNDTYPVVGFPSPGPIDTDEIVRKNKAMLKGRTEKIIFASMNDPFQLSMRLNSAIDEIQGVFGKDANIIISPHGSKAQSVGILITAMSRAVSIMYCQPLSYFPRRGGIGSSHLYWLKGTPYDNKKERMHR